MTDTVPAHTPTPRAGNRIGYDAFLSYAHADRNVATGIQKSLHQIGRRVGQLRALRVFRDDTNLEASPDLWAEITEALDNARYLVMVLSPAAAASYWVDKEISYWLEHRGSTEMLLVVAAGTLRWKGDRFDPDLSDAAPPALTAADVLTAEPLYIDVSTDSPWDPRAAAFRDKVTSIAAPIHGKDKDVLGGEDLSEQRKFRRLRAAAVAALTLITVVAVVAGWMAVVKRNEAQHQRNEAQDKLLEATRTRLVAEAEAMMADTKTGTDDQAFKQLLAASVLTRATEVDGALYTAVATKADTDKIIKLSEPVYSVAVFPEKSLMASGSGDNTVRLWDLRSRKVIRSLTGHTASVWGLAFSPDGSLLASASDDHTVRLWNTANGDQFVLPTYHTEAVRQVAFSPDGSRLATASFDHHVGIWDVAGRKLIQMLDHSSDVYAVAFNHDGSLLASASDDRTVQLWDATKRELTKVGNPMWHDKRVRAVAFNHDGSQLVSGSRDEFVRVWDTATQGLVGQPLAGHQGAVYDVTFSPDGSKIVSSSRDGTIRVWDAKSHELVGNPITGHDGIVNAVTFLNSQLISCSNDGTIRFWNLDVARPFTGHSASVRSVAVSGDGLIATGGDDGTVRMWDAASRQSTELGHHEGPVRSVAFSPDGRRVVSGSEDATVREWDVASKSAVVTARMAHKGKVYSVAFSPDGHRVVSGSDDHTVRLWNADDGAPIGHPMAAGDPHRVYAVAFSRDGSRVISGGDDNMVRIWDVSSFKEARPPLSGHQDPVWSLAVDRGGRIASGSADNSVRLWDGDTGNLIKALPERDVVWGVAFGRDGNRLASASGGNTVQLWDVGSGAPAPIGDPLRGHSGAVNGVAFSPQGERMYTASDDATVRVWPTTASRENLCSKLTTTMTEDQWKAWVSPSISYTNVCPGLPESLDP